MRKHENYRELVWMLAKTDFKLRYQGSVLGYVWALLKPLLMFLVLNFVFSSIFNPRNVPGAEYYSLQLLTAIMMFNFFAEGTNAGMSSLLNKSQLVTKIYVPRWTIILASTLNSALIYSMNLLIIIGFFIYKGFLPSTPSIILFFIFSINIYVLVVSFAFLTAPLYVKFRDLSMIWEVLVQILFYATPIVYPLQMMPANVQQLLLINPMAFIVHYTKESLINNHFADLWKTEVFLVTVAAGFIVSMIAYRKFIPRVAEDI